MCTWSDLPDIIIEQIYDYLSMKDRYRCSLVCYNWYDIFYSPRIWRRMVVEETMFTTRQYNILGFELVLNQERVKLYLGKVGRHVKYIVVLPTFDFHYLHNFFVVLVAFLEFFEDYPMPHLQSFEFTLACESRIPVVGPVVLGTGGRLLEMIIHLLGNLKNMKRLVLNNLLLEYRDAPGVLEKVVDNGSKSLVYVELLNFTKERCPLFQIGMLHSLRKLVITPLQLTDDVVIMLADSTQLEDLVIVQDKYSNEAEPVTGTTWQQVRGLQPNLRVHLQVRGVTHAELLMQEKAPVSSVIHGTPYAKMSTPEAFRIVENYKNTLMVFGHTTLPRRHGPRSFHCRGDSGYVLLVRECTKLHTLIIRERISTATLLILAFEGSGKSMKELYIRRNAVLLRSDWPKPVLWDEKRYQWLKKVSQSYDLVEQEVSMLLGYKWNMMSDVEFKRLEDTTLK